MNDQNVQQFIQDALNLAADEGWEEYQSIESIGTYEEKGVLTMDKGLVITMEDGSEFQLTIVQSRVAR